MKLLLRLLLLAMMGSAYAQSNLPACQGSDSPYTKHLVRALQQKGLPIEQVFKQVRIAVVEETKGNQVPWENSSIMGDFYFRK